MNIKFECFCGQPVEVNSDAAGQEFKCPGCGTGLVVPTIMPKPFRSEIPPMFPKTTPKMSMPPVQKKYYGPQAPKSDIISLLAKTGVGIFGVLLIWGIWSSSSSPQRTTNETPIPPSGQTSSDLKTMDISVKVYNQGLGGLNGFLISNTGDVDIHGIKIYIGNPMSFKGAYEYTSDKILEKNKQIGVELSDFNKRDGERFNYLKYKVVEVWIGGGQDNYGLQQMFF